jgi:hypothetical protein
MKDSVIVGSKDKSLIGENWGETRHQDREVQAELQPAVNLSVSPSIHICKKKLNTSSTVNVQRQLEVSNALFQVQQDTCIGERGGKTQYERPEYQSIVSLDGDSFVCEVCDITLPNSACVEQHLTEEQHTKNLATKAVKIERIWNMVIELEGGKTENIHMTTCNRFNCTLCHINIHATFVVSHVGGRTHQQKLKELRETSRKHRTRSQKRKPHNVHSIWNDIYAAENGKWSNIKCVSPETFHCEPCNTPLPVHEVLAHVTAASHQQAIRAPEIIRMNETLNTIANLLWKEMHDADRTHQAYFNIDNKTVVYCTSCCVRVPATALNVTDHIRGKTHMSTVVRNLLSQHPSVMKQTNSSLEENSQNFKPTQTQNFAKGKPKEKSECSSENLSDSRSTQLQIKSVVCGAQEVPLKALVPKEEESSEHIASKHQGKLVLFHCVVCNTEIESKELWYQHQCSQEHNLETSKLVAEGKNPITYNCPICCATVFCIESDLVKHTCQEVQNKGQLCILSETAENAHLVNRRTATELCHQEDMKDEEQDDETANVSRIVVSGYPRGIGMDLLHHFFQDFGTISFVGVSGESAVIEFIEDDAVEKTLERQLFLENSPLTVKKFTHFNCMNPVSVHEIVVSAFISPQSIEETLNNLCEASKSVSYGKKDIEVCQFVERLFYKVYKGCRAIPFGSRVSGLASSDSDLDVFLDTGSMYSGKHRQESAIQELIVSDVKNTLLDHPECCSVEGVPNARTPIVRFFHKPSLTRCDLAFRHGLGCENTKLIKFYLSLDVRVRPVILFLKHWASLHKLTGPCNITNYALTWLVIFYLQEASGFGLPSVELLQRLHTGPVRIIAGWECSFGRSIPKVPVIRSTQTVVQLLHGFFTYYNKFDFSNNVVCPLVGYPVGKQYFYKPQNLPHAMDNYVSRVMKCKHAEKFRTKCSMCVQDPFDLSHNLTKGTSQAILNKFKVLCSHTADLCAKFCH